jgi:uncharacterized protein YbcI
LEVPLPSIGALEARIANAAGRFQREQQGRGPEDVRVHLAGRLVLVHSTGIFTTTESHLAASDEGRRLIKSARQELRSIHKRDIEGIVADITDCAVERSYYDIDAEAGEQVEVYVLDRDLEKVLEWGGAEP